MKPVIGLKKKLSAMRPETGVQPSVAGKEDDQQQAPPEDRHGIADERGAHQSAGRTSEPRLTAAKMPAGMPMTMARIMREERQFDRRREQRHELVR
ncbi:MAG: hypothetical protein V9G20_30005 [Candidatus Promineifilaceae bacterium]